jgi:hypothetical protein
MVDMVRKGSTINFEQISTSIRKIKKVPTLVNRSIVSVENTNLKNVENTVTNKIYTNDRYVGQMKYLVQHATSMIQALEERIAMVQHMYQQCARFLGANIKEGPEKVFLTMKEFISNFLEAHASNQLLVERKERKMRLAVLAKKDALQRKKMKMIRLQKKSMYPETFKMLKFKRGKYPLHGGRNRTRGKTGTRNGKRWSGESTSNALRGKEETSVLNELELEMLRRKKGGSKRERRGKKKKTFFSKHETNEEKKGEEDTHLHKTTRKKNRTTRRNVYVAHPTEFEMDMSEEFSLSVDFGITKGCENFWHELENDAMATNWVLFRFEQSPKKTMGSSSSSSNTRTPTWRLMHYKKGGGGMDEMNTVLQASPLDCLYGGFRVNAIDERESVTSLRCKLIFVSYFGSHVKPRIKSNSGMYIGQITSMCQGTHVRLHSDGINVIEKAEVIKALSLSTGSHKPTSWEF